MEPSLDTVRQELADVHGIDGAFDVILNRAIDSGMGIDDVEARRRRMIEQMRSSG